MYSIFFVLLRCFSNFDFVRKKGTGAMPNTFAIYAVSYFEVYATIWKFVSHEKPLLVLCCVHFYYISKAFATVFVKVANFVQRQSSKKIVSRPCHAKAVKVLKLKIIILKIETDFAYVSKHNFFKLAVFDVNTFTCYLFLSNTLKCNNI